MWISSGRTRAQTRRRSSLTPSRRPRRAARTSLSATRPDGREIVARGECPGRILYEKHGAGGFGYDPVFYLPEYGMTYAELPPEKKNEISHRGNALREFVRLYKEKHYDDK